ncbi:hypothetical protein [Vibrio sp. OPT18]|uniref:hypothetical protein n=1 Tax=Vibrio sp. OPT18 TaxID=2778641 RepID=UPI001882C26F|nr:hypothetical protein [Vibrio sp. OPT18]MBE8577435.1 hypothetical protein [Vibrio sp. OPT18]
MTTEIKEDELEENSNQEDDSIEVRKVVMLVVSILSIPQVSEMIKVFIAGKKDHTISVIIAKTLLTLSIVVASTWLSYLGLFNSTMGVLFGSIAGYILSNK